MKTGHSLYFDVRGLRCHARCWGPGDAPLLIMLHGWLHSSAAFQFTVDSLQNDWRVVAPDWRGFGASQWASSYWFEEYLADLEQIVDHFSPDAPVNIVGHSFGGVVASVYAGIRPDRIARFFNVDGIGAPEWKPEETPRRYAELIALLEQEREPRDYPSLEDLQQRMAKGELAKVSAERLAWLTREWTRATPEGKYRLVNDPMHAKRSITMHYQHRLGDVMACWRAITAPTLFLVPRQGTPVRNASYLSDGRFEERLAQFRTAKVVWMEDTGHMVPMERPAELAALIEEFFPFGAA